MLFAVAALIAALFASLFFILWIREKKKRYTIEVDEPGDFCFNINLKLSEIRKRLAREGYEINYPLQHIIHVRSWNSTQVIGARRVVNDHQYHIRVYPRKGFYSICAHYEITPEADPIKHLNGTGLEVDKGCEEAKRIFGDVIIWRPPSSQT